MLPELIKIEFVSPIRFKYRYAPRDSSRKFYFPDYEIEKPQLVPKEDLKTIPYSSGCTILIVKNGNYYWCPQFEKMYKDTRSDSAKRGLVRNAQLYVYSDGNIFKFEYGKTVYRTHEVKTIKLV